MSIDRTVGGSDDSAPARAAQEAADGDALYVQGNFKAALARYREAARLRPTEAGYHYKVALSAWAHRAFHLVETHFQQALRLAPNQPQLHDAMGQWYLEQADVERALAHSARAAELAPGHPGVAISRAFVLDGAGRTEEAWRTIEP